jgi:hypothetical protein
VLVLQKAEKSATMALPLRQPESYGAECPAGQEEIKYLMKSDN